MTNKQIEIIKKLLFPATIDLFFLRNNIKHYFDICFGHPERREGNKDYNLLPCSSVHYFSKQICDICKEITKK